MSIIAQTFGMRERGTRGVGGGELPRASRGRTGWAAGRGRTAGRPSAGARGRCCTPQGLAAGGGRRTAAQRRQPPPGRVRGGWEGARGGADSWTSCCRCQRAVLYTSRPRSWWGATERSSEKTASAWEGERGVRGRADSWTSCCRCQRAVLYTSRPRSWWGRRTAAQRRQPPPGGVRGGERGVDSWTSFCRCQRAVLYTSRPRSWWGATDRSSEKTASAWGGRQGVRGGADSWTSCCRCQKAVLYTSRPRSWWGATDRSSEKTASAWGGREGGRTTGRPAAGARGRCCTPRGLVAGGGDGPQLREDSLRLGGGERGWEGVRGEGGGEGRVRRDEVRGEERGKEGKRGERRGREGKRGEEGKGVR